MAEMDVSDAVAIAQGEDNDGDNDNGEATFSDTSSDDGDNGDDVFTRLFDGNAGGPNLREFKQTYGFDTSRALMLRGVARVAPGHGVPPIGEMLIGGFLEFRKASSQSADDGDNDNADRLDNDNDDGGIRDKIARDDGVTVVGNE